MKKLVVLSIILIFLVSCLGCERTERANTAQNATYVNTNKAGIILEEGYPVWEEHQLPMYQSYPVWEELVLTESNPSGNQ